MTINDYIRLIIENMGLLLEYIGLAIVAGSAFISLYKVMLPKFTTEHVRHHFAKRVIFGLEFVIAADILLATVATDFQQILQLGGIVLIRVVLGYTLRKEAGFK